MFKKDRLNRMGKFRTCVRCEEEFLLFHNKVRLCPDCEAEDKEDEYTGPPELDLGEEASRKILLESKPAESLATESL